MPVIHLETEIVAPIEICFDVARSIDVHEAAASKTSERAVAGVTSGLIGLGETVTWEAVHFGITQRLTSHITRYERPHLFVDEMVKGAFHSFTHIHEFKGTSRGTLMIDEFSYTAPLGLLCRIADRLFLKVYMETFLQERASHLKHVAEDFALLDSGAITS
ncbi:MAG: SRPBCC family protein [Chloroflexota bacterium]|nr:SRPBCC family protein [Chloroflexota bacterium]